MPLHEVHFYGAVNAGKSAALVCLYEYLASPDGQNDSKVLGVQPSAGLRARMGQLRTARGALDATVHIPPPKAPEDASPDVQAYIDGLDQNAEWALVTFADKMVLYWSHAGHHFPATEEVVRRCNRPRQLFVGVINPFLLAIKDTSNSKVEQSLAERFFPELIAGIQERYKRASLKASCEMAVNLLLHLDRPDPALPAALPPAPPPPPPPAAAPGAAPAPAPAAPSVLDTAIPGLSALLDTVTNGKLVERDGKWEVSGADADTSQKIVKLIRGVAFNRGEVATSYGSNLQLILKRLGRSVIVLTHYDLATFLSPGLRETFDAYLDVLFDQRDRLMSQQVYAGSLEYDLVVDPATQALDRPKVITNNEIGRRLCRSIDKQLTRVFRLPQEDEHQGAGPSEYLREVAYHTLVWFPLVVFLAVLACLWRGDVRELFPFVVSGGVTLVTVAAAVSWARAQFAGPAWEATRDGDAIRITLRRWFGGGLDVPETSVRVFRRRLLTGLTGCGYAKVGANKLRRYHLPAVKRFERRLESRTPGQVEVVWGSDLVLALLVAAAVGLGLATWLDQPPVGYVGRYAYSWVWTFSVAVGALAAIALLVSDE